MSGEIINEIFGGQGAGGGGGVVFFWNPLATPGQYGYQEIQAGVKKAGNYQVINYPTQTTVDDVPQNTSTGTVIGFRDDGTGWTIISQTSQQARRTSPSSVADETELNATFPTPENYQEQFCYVQSTNTFWTVKLQGLVWVWYNTGEAVIDDAYSKPETDALLQANSITDRNRNNHTGTQLASTISDFDVEVSNNIDVSANTSARHTHANKALLDATQESFTTVLKTNYNTAYTHSQTSGNPHNTSHTQLTDIGTNTHNQIDAHIASTTNPHNVTKAQVGLGNVDNTSDVNKPVSTATQIALDTKVEKVTGKQLSTEDYTTAEKTKLAGIQAGAEVNVQANWSETNNTLDSFIQNKPTLGTVASKNVGTAIGNIQENGAILANSAIVETDGTGKFITVSKNTAYNKNFGILNDTVARGDASYLKADTYTKTEIDNLNGLKQSTSEKGQPNGYASLDGTGKVPASQLPSFVDDVLEDANLASFPAVGETGKVYVALDTNFTYRWSGSIYVKLNDVDLTNYFNKVTDTTDNITQGTAKFATIAEKTKLSNITITQPVDLDQLETDTVANNAKITNQTHTGEVTGATALTIVNNVVVNSKLAQVATNTVKGRITAGTGNVEDIQIDTTLKTALNLNNVTNDAQLKIASNLSDVNNRQTALNNLTNAAGATNEYVLTKDTTTGNAIFKAITSITVVDNLISTDANLALSANQGRILNNDKEPAFTKNSAFNKNFGSTAGTVAQGSDSRFVVKRLNILIGSSTTSNKKGVSFSYGTTISSPFFSLTITSSNNNDAFCVKVVQITTTSAYLEVYRADGGSWGDNNVSCMVTIYDGVL